MLFVLAVVVAACGGGAQEPPAEQPTGATITTLESTTTTEAVTTTSEAEAGFTFARFGAGAVEALPGSDGMLGSGCTPGPGQLPDGIWFGWIESTGPAQMSFDLACLEPGSPPVATNSNPQVRDVMFSPEARIHRADGSTVAGDQWSPTDDPVWIYVNRGIALEVAYPTIEIVEAAAPLGWSEADVEMPVGGGCCGEMFTGAAPSPSDPWPASGLPADGVYAVDMTIDRAAGDLVLVIRRFVACADRPEQCVPDWRAGDMQIDPGEAIARRVALDDNLTVRLRGLRDDPNEEPSVTPGVEGPGTAFAQLLDDREAAWDAYIGAEIEAGTHQDNLGEYLKQRGEADPDFPYGASATELWPDALVYRGPLGLEMLEWLGPSSGYLGPTQLEMVNGLPVLTIDVGRLAG